MLAMNPDCTLPHCRYLSFLERCGMLYKMRDVCLGRQKGDSGFELHVSSLAIGYGEFNFIVGESGCGKSTLMDGLGLLLRPSSAESFLIQPKEGSRTFDAFAVGESTVLRLRRKHIGFVLQSGGLIGSLSVRQNIVLSASLAQTSVASERIQEVVEQLGLENCLTRRPGDLSGGQRQRVAIARAVLHAPSIILADEPTAAVDHDRAYEICRIFRDLVKSSGCTAVMVTHNRELAEKFGDRILRLPSPTVRGSFSRSEISWEQ